MFRSSWQMDYPSIENFLIPIYAKGSRTPTGAIMTTQSSQADHRGRRGKDGG